MSTLKSHLVINHHILTDRTNRSVIISSIIMCWQRLNSLFWSWLWRQILQWRWSSFCSNKRRWTCTSLGRHNCHRSTGRSSHRPDRRGPLSWQWKRLPWACWPWHQRWSCHSRCFRYHGMAPRHTKHHLTNIMIWSGRRWQCSQLWLRSLHEAVTPPKRHCDLQNWIIPQRQRELGHHFSIKGIFATHSLDQAGMSTKEHRLEFLECAHFLVHRWQSISIDVGISSVNLLYMLLSPSVIHHVKKTGPQHRKGLVNTSNLLWKRMWRTHVPHYSKNHSPVYNLLVNRPLSKPLRDLKWTSTGP